LAQKGNLASASEFVLPLLVLVLAATVYGLYGFDDVMLRDYAIYLYSGQRMAEGVPPYVSVFDHKGPLSPMLAGLGVMLSNLFGWDDVLSVRLVFYTIACLTVVAVYLLGRSAFRSQMTGLFAALTFLGFYAYAQPAASGPEPKTPMVLFEALSLLFMVQKRWFWAGLCGSLAFLVWQPMGIFPFVAFLLAVTRPKEERRGAVLRAMAGIMTPLVATVAYFYYHGALGDLLDGVLLFNVLYIARDSESLTEHLMEPAGVIAATYSTMVLPIIIGLVAILRLYFIRPFQYRFAPLLISFPVVFLWSLQDFQLGDDFFPFLPYVAVGFGAFLVFVVSRTRVPPLGAVLLGAILLGIALANTLEVVNADSAYALKGTTIDLRQQREGALKIEDRLGKDAKLSSINSPQVLVLLHKTNPNPYLWLTAGVDREIDAATPGGFKTWIQDLEASNSDAIAFFGEGQSLMFNYHLTSEHNRELDNWLNPHYHAEKIGPWWLFVKDSSIGVSDRQASINGQQKEGSFGPA
jgi:hypothetical protein